MRKTRRRQERTVLILLFGGAAGLSLFVLAVFGSHKWYQNWQAKRFARRAQTYLSWGDLKSATLTARQVLEFDPNNADGCQVMAEVMERHGMPAAIEWRQRIADHNPRSLPDAIALAKTALKFRQFDKAEAALRQFAATAQSDASYHEVSGQLAMAKNQPAKAESHFQRALTLEPQNRLFQLELSTIQLSATDTKVRDAAQERLEHLIDDSALRVNAARVLLKNAVEHKNPSVVHLAEMLFSFPEAPFADRLICLEVFARLETPQFTTALTQLQEQAAQSPENLSRLISWMSANSLTLVALDWIKRLSAEALRKRPVFMAVADCYVATHDCAGLQNWCNSGEWRDLECLRHAYLARSLRDCGDPISSELEWSKAVKIASGPEAAESLQRTVAQWDWRKQSIELLWQLANYPDKQAGALGTLFQYYSEQGDTADLYRVASRLSRILPNDAQVQNNFAQLALLLNVDLERARELARQLYQSHRTDPSIASTYAYGLFTQGRKQEALEVMNSLGNEALSRPEIAAYYTIVLSAAGDWQKAQQFFEISKQARLLPEERTVVDQAIARR